MTTQGPETGAPIDATETLVRERFEGAVGDVHFDVASLVGAGTAAGQRLRRRRHLQVATAAVGGVAVIAAAGLVGINGGLFHNSTPPAHQDNVERLVPSNSRALAAAVISDLPPTVKVTEVQGGSGAYGAISADFSTVMSGHPVPINVVAYKPEATRLDCKGRNHENSDVKAVCTIVTLPDGGKARFDFGTEFPGTAKEIPALVAFAHRPNEILMVAINDHALPHGVFPGEAATFRAIALRILSDPAVGQQTYQRFVDAQGSVPSFKTFQSRPEPSESHSPPR